MSKLRYGAWCLAAALAAIVFSSDGRAAEPPGFDSYLAQGYREIAVFALNQLDNAGIAAHFASRAETTDLAGSALDPETVEQWKMDRRLALEARSARRELMDRLGQDARWSAPLTSAIAVLNFDCWLGFAAVDPASSGECRRRFLAALQALPAHSAASPAFAPAGTQTLMVLAACAAPPWLGDCPMQRDGRDAPDPAGSGERHAAGEVARPALTALAAPPAGISALAESPAAPAADEAEAALPPPGVAATLAGTVEPLPAVEPSD